MRVRRLAPIPLLMLVMGGSGCGSDDLESEPSIPVSELPAKFSESVCGALADCYGAELEWLLGGETCDKRFGDQVSDTLPEIEAGIESGRVKYSGTALQACLDAVRAGGCKAGELFESDVCHAALDGTVELGGDCDHALECAGEAYCKSSGSCPGTCTAREAVGATCSDDDQCAAVLKCSDVSQRCYEPSAAGDLCGGAEGKECQGGLFCLGQDEQSGAAGNCRALGEVLTGKTGESCSLLAGPLCESGLSCAVESFDGTNLVMKCMSRVASGAACKIAGPDMCPSGEYCDVPAGTFDGTCKKMPLAGEPCAKGPFEDVASICGAYTRCEAGTCRALASLGSTCQTDAVCMSETCVGGQCALDGSCG